MLPPRPRASKPRHAPFGRKAVTTASFVVRRGPPIRSTQYGTAGITAKRHSRIAAGTVLVLHDTTGFSFARDTPDGVGDLSYVKGRHGTHTACGVLLHSSLAVTTDGLPLGLAAAKSWTRKTFKGTSAAKRTVNPTAGGRRTRRRQRAGDRLTQYVSSSTTTNTAAATASTRPHAAADIGAVWNAAFMTGA